MGNWGADHFQVRYERNPLQRVVDRFPANLKQAMYAAAERQTLRKGTWDGCAFNAAGRSVDAQVASTSTAAATFNVDPKIVNDFIETWDSYAAEESRATEILKRCLLKAGLFDGPRSAVVRLPGKFVYSDVIFKSDRTKFEEIMDGEDFDFDSVEIEAAGDLLVSI